jgi:hypothetical protein
VPRMWGPDGSRSDDRIPPLTATPASGRSLVFDPLQHHRGRETPAYATSEGSIDPPARRQPRPPHPVPERAPNTDCGFEQLVAAAHPHDAQGCFPA